MIFRDRLEVDVVSTCNLSCKSCGHASPYFKKNSYSIEEFRNDVNVLSKVLHVQWFDLLGGEPTLLGSKLADYSHVVKDSGIAEKLCMITNGILLIHPRFEPIIPLFDGRIQISLYRHSYREKILEWYEQKKNQFPNVQIVERDSFIKVFDPRNPKLTEEETKRTFANCAAKTWCNQIFKGRYVKCQQSYGLFEMLKKEGVEFEDPGQVGIDLHAPNLEERLKAFIASEEMEKACSFCRINLNEWEPWQEVA